MPQIKAEKKQQQAKSKKTATSKYAEVCSRTAARLAKMAARAEKLGRGSPAEHAIQAVRATVDKARELVLQAASTMEQLVEAGWLPEEKTKASKIELAPGLKVRIREEFVGEYKGLLTDEDAGNLQVALVNKKKHVFVRIGPEGSKRALGFTPRSHLVAIL